MTDWEINTTNDHPLVARQHTKRQADVFYPNIRHAMRGITRERLHMGDQEMAMIILDACTLTGTTNMAHI